MSKTLVLYHGNCADGHCAAWAARRKLGDAADYRPVHHGQPAPDVRGRAVYLLDFSYKRPVIEEMARDCKRLTILDHHKTARAELAGLTAPNLHVAFDMEKSGGRLAWEHFFPGQAAHWLVRYTEDRDLWRWALDYSQEVNAYLASLPQTFQAWDGLGLMPAPLEYMVNDGAAILRYQGQQVEAAVANAVEIELDGHRVLCVNCTHLTSEIAGRLAEGRPFGAAYFIRGDGRRVWSLRSRGGIDVSEVARRHGGGGHRDAAGFEDGGAQ